MNEFLSKFMILVIGVAMILVLCGSCCFYRATNNKNSRDMIADMFNGNYWQWMRTR